MTWCEQKVRAAIMRIDLRWIISKSIETREVAGLSAIRK